MKRVGLPMIRQTWTSSRTVNRAGAIKREPISMLKFRLTVLGDMESAAISFFPLVYLTIAMDTLAGTS